MRKKMLLAIVCVLLLVSTTAALEPGDTLWTRTYGGTEWENGYSVQQTSDGGYIIAGRTWSFGAGGSDAYLLKIDSSGDTLWTRTYGGSYDDGGFSVQQTSDGGYIIAGWTGSFGAGDIDVYLVKADSSGDPLWTRTYGGSYYDDAYSVQLTSDGGYIIAGITESFGAGGWDVYLLKTNSSGDTLWTCTYGGSYDDGGFSVQQTSDGGYIIAGSTESFGAGSADVYLVKTDSSGDTLWTRTYGGTAADVGRSVQQTADGGYIIAGYTYSFGAGDADVYLLKTDSSGDTLWTRTYGGSDYDRGWPVQQTSDGGYIIAGHTYSFGAGLSDVYLLRIAGEPLTLTIVPGDTLVAHNDTLCYHLICQNNTPDYLQLSFKVEVRLPNGQMYGPIFGPARFGMFGNGVSEGDMCHRVPPQAPTGDYWLFAEVYNLEFSARDSMAFTITGDGELANAGSPSGDWQTVLARLGGEDLIGRGVDFGLPAQFALNSNYPNPFNAQTVIQYQLPVNSNVRLEVYNLLGEKVATLVNGEQDTGYKSVTWDASDVSSGVYFYKLSAGDFTETKRMMLVK